MFLNGLKAKSIYRKVKKEVKERSYRPDGKKIKTVAILQNEDRPFAPTYIKQLAEALHVHDKDITQMTLVKLIEKKDQFETDIYSERQIGWNGVLKSTWLKDFCKAKYDVLINYYEEDALPLVAVGVFSKARFKVGLTEELASMNDLVVTVALGEEKILIDEMTKYMHILKMIN